MKSYKIFINFTNKILMIALRNDIRIENDVLITKTGCIILTEKLLREVEQVDEMRK